MEHSGSPKPSGFDALLSPPKLDNSFDLNNLTYSLNPDYVAYLKIHKILVGSSGGKQLESIFESLQKEQLPRLLHAAGWAAVESGLAQTEKTALERNTLVESGVACWMQALSRQAIINEDGEHQWLIEDSPRYRLALDIAHAPLFQAIIAGNLTPQTKKNAIEDTMRISALAQSQLALASSIGNRDAMADFSGFGYECNGLIVLNTITDSREAAVPSSSRADSGHHYREQTHDLTLISQHWGAIRNITPIEIKAAASRRDRERYHALIIRGKMHLSVPGKHSSRHTLESLIRYHEGNPTPEDVQIVTHAKETIIDLLRLYKKGQKLGMLATKRTVTTFHDKQYVEHLYAGDSKTRK